MVVALLIAGIGFLLAGLLAVAVGIPVKEFSFGNTMILAGVVGVCTGAILLAVLAIVRKLEALSQRMAGLGLAGLGPSGIASSQPVVPAPFPATLEVSRERAADGDAFTFNRDQPGTARVELPAPSPPHLREETPIGDRAHDETPPEPEPAAAPVVKPRRNLLFSSTVRKDRDRAESRVADAGKADPRPVPPAAGSPATFDDAWPQSQRMRSGEGPQRRNARPPSTFADDAAADRPSLAPPPAEPPAVTVLKSGVVDGMAYSLYSDGSIEAQMPEGMMRFASIDELRTHLEQRT